MKGIKRVSTRNMSRPEWLARRRNTIGGSDAAAIVGLSRYGSQYSVFMDKTGRLPDKPDTEAMRQGRDLEEYVASRFTAVSRLCFTIRFTPSLMPMLTAWYAERTPDLSARQPPRWT